jgi:hypothetical protein
MSLANTQLSKPALKMKKINTYHHLFSQEKGNATSFCISFTMEYVFVKTETKVLLLQGRAQTIE